ncbi:MAG: DNA polymerase III subunit delta' [Polynucleobacter sp.]|nr:DNA polymerase III subunit delta' [Polynucleobacter sp.]MDZ4055407.1 DNA polymerase III subunit delta' [Polynucleobacter sp.]
MRQTEAIPRSWVVAPWLNSLWDGINLKACPNAVLIHGRPGIGKYDFAITLAKALLCEGSGGAIKKPCNACEACRWFDTGNHPDFVGLVPETHRRFLPSEVLEGAESDAGGSKKTKAVKDDEGDSAEKKEKKNITIEDARSAIQTLSIGTHRGGNRVVLVYPLEALRSEAANTLLKSLEEPPSGTIFILVTSRLDRVLPTIRSRCRLLAAPPPDHVNGLAWLKEKIAAQNAIKVSGDELETIFYEQGGAPYAVFEFLTAKHHQNEKDELFISIQASRYLLQGLAQGSRINWLDVAEKTHKASFADLLGAMQRWLADVQGSSQAATVRFYPKHAKTIHTLGQQIRLEKLLRLSKLVTQARRHENHPLATRIQLESLLMQYQQLFQD